MSGDLNTAGWSVVVHGRAARHTAFDNHARQRSRRIWLDVDKAHLLRVTPSAITGRRIPARPISLPRTIEASRATNTFTL
jgi:hypothetical protein